MAMSFDMQIIKQSVLSSNIIYVILFVYILHMGTWATCETLQFWNNSIVYLRPPKRTVKSTGVNCSNCYLPERWLFSLLREVKASSCEDNSRYNPVALICLSLLHPRSRMRNQSFDWTDVLSIQPLLPGTMFNASNIYLHIVQLSAGHRREVMLFAWNNAVVTVQEGQHHYQDVAGSSSILEPSIQIIQYRRKSSQDVQATKDCNTCLCVYTSLENPEK